MNKASATDIGRALYEWDADQGAWSDLQSVQREIYRKQARYLMRRFNIVRKGE